MSYLPGNPFHYRFINTALNENKKKVLQTKMQHRLREIRKEYYGLTGWKRIRMVGRKKNTRPCQWLFFQWIKIEKTPNGKRP